MAQLLKTYKDRVGRIVTLSKEGKKYTISTKLGTVMTSFSFNNRTSFEKEVKSKYKKDNIC